MTPKPLVHRTDAPAGVRQLSAGANCTGTTYTVINVGSPPLGQKWSLTQLTVTPLDPFGAPAIGVQAMALRTVGHFVTGNVEPSSFPGIIAPPAPIPNSLTLARDVVTIGLNEQLTVVVQNAPAGTVILVDAEVHQSPLASYERQKRRHWMQVSARLG